ncbi:MAG: cytochrome c-type biogenesis protein CcmH, partial [Gemmatimonadales bacterium]
LEAGNTPDEVVAAFVAKYGEEVLMAPIPEGFNLTGYLLPGAALLVAGSILTTVLWRRHRMAQVAEPMEAGVGGAPPPVAGASADELARLEEALQEVER